MQWFNISMSEFRELPSAGEYVKVMYDLNREIEAMYVDAEYAAWSYKERNKSAFSFHALATSNARQSLYLEPRTHEGALEDPMLVRARAFMKGVFLGEMINDTLFQEESHATAFLWLNKIHQQKAVEVQGATHESAGDIVRMQLRETSVNFVSGLLPPSKMYIAKWALSGIAQPDQESFTLGIGHQLAAGYGYQAHVNNERALRDAFLGDSYG